MHTPSSKAAIGGLLIGLSLQAAEAAYVVSDFALPGSTHTSLWGINDRGEVVGDSDATGGGFLISGGHVTRLTGPQGALGTSANGITSSGVVAGTWWDSSTAHEVTYFVTDPVTGQQTQVTSTAYNSKGFLFGPTGYQVFSAPFIGATSTMVRAISSNGRFVSGTYESAMGQSSFVWDRTADLFTDMGSVPSLAGTSPTSVGPLVVAGVNSSGQVVGTGGFNERRGFIYGLTTNQATTFTSPGTSRTAPRGINDDGLLTGWAAPLGESASRAFVGTPDQVEWLSMPGNPSISVSIGQGINAYGQVVGNWTDENGVERAFIASPAELPVGSTPGGGYVFDVQVLASQPVFIDPFVAVGYLYEIGSGDPLFQSVSLPIGIGDDQYVLIIDGQAFPLGGGDIFDFTAHGFGSGVSRFEVAGIEPAALVDPGNPQAFVTRLTFMSDGRFTGTQTPVTTFFDGSVPAPASASLLLLGLALLRRRSRLR